MRGIIVILVVLVAILVLIGVLNFGRIGAGDWMQIILLLALVVVTWSYARSADQQAKASLKMATQMEQQRIDSYRPILAIESRDLELHMEDTHTIQLRKVRFSNVGVGPAINVRATLTYPGFTFEPKGWPVVAIGESKDTDFATSFSGGLRDEVDIGLSLTYADVFGHPRHTLASFKANEARQVITEHSPLIIG